MYKFRKKPVVIEAFQMTKKRRSDNSEWPIWLHKAWNSDGGRRLTISDDGSDRLIIETLEGNHLVSWDDYIIQGIKGELYPCKPDIFEATYEKVE